MTSVLSVPLYYNRHRETSLQGGGMFIFHISLLLNFISKKLGKEILYSVIVLL